MKKITVVVFLILLSNNLLFSQLISFNFNSEPFLQANQQNDTINASVLSLSSGTVSTHVLTGDYFTDEPYIEESGGWAETDALLGKYFYVDLAANSGFQFTIDSVKVDYYVTGSGPSAISLIIDDSLIQTNNVMDAILYQEQFTIVNPDTLTQIRLKLAGWDNGSRITSGGGAFRIDNFQVFGKLSAVPPNDTTSSILLTNYLMPDEIASITNNSPGAKVIEFVIADSANTDMVATKVDSLFFTQNQFNQIANWTDAIAGAKLIVMRNNTIFTANVTENALMFETSGQLDIANGTTDTLELYLWLKQTLPGFDRRQLGMQLTPENVYTDSTGSQISFTPISTNSNGVIIQVAATQMQADLSEKTLFSDATFAIQIAAIDVNGNLDSDESGDILISYKSDEAHWAISNPIIGNFLSGNYLVENLNFQGSDTVYFTVASNNFDTLKFTKYVGKSYFFDDFENDLSQWYPSADWLIETNPDNGILQHGLTDVEGTSFISSNLKHLGMKTGKMVWRLTLKNGDFDPTSSNRFWYYLMASDSNLVADTVFGYAVGVNLLGTTDSLSLWKVQASGTKTLLLQSDFDWNENQSVAIEVIRENSGLWQLGYKISETPDYLYTSQIIDTTFYDLAYHGLIFQYSSTRAGELWLDDLSVFQLNMPPVIEQAYAEGDTITVQFSEDLDSLNVSQLANYSITSLSDTAVEILAAVINSQDSSQLRIITNRLRTAAYQLQVSNITDVDGSVMHPQTVNFSYQVPAAKGDVVINEILFDYSPVVGLPEADFVEIYNNSNEPFYLNNWLIEIDESSKTLPDAIIYPNHYLIITTTAAVESYTTFGHAIGLISGTVLTNTGKSIRLISSNGLLIDSVFYHPEWIRDPEKEDGGWALERIDPNNLCGAAQNWKASENPAGGTPGAQNSVFAENIDTVSPQLVSQAFVQQNVLQFTFSEELAVASVLDTTHWHILPRIELDSIHVMNESTGVLYFADNLANNQEYNLQISGIQDYCGNRLQDTSITLLFHKTEAFDLVFNELMVDWEPVQGLPESDYIELYNRSAYALELENWELYYGSTRKVFTDEIVMPGQYLLIVQNEMLSFYTDAEHVVEMLSSSSLPVSDKSLVLKDTTGTVIDSVYYKKSWYHNPEKEDGGWALERIDPENHCSTIANWTASEDLAGGTPGSQNSVFAENIDVITPKLTSFKSRSNNRLLLDFSEELPKNAALLESNFEILNVSNPLDTVFYTDDSERQLELVFSYPFVSESNYEIQISGITDYCGNVISDTVLTFLYYQSQTNDIIFTEIMADPTPAVALPESRFLEIYNRSAYPIQLENWRITYDNYFKIFPEFEIQPASYVILCPSGNSGLFSSYGQVIDLLSTTTLNTTGKTLRLVDTSETVITYVTYSSDWYQNPDKVDGGWSLERIDPDNLCSAAQNWRAAENLDGGTPGSQNSVNGNTMDNIPPVITRLKTRGSKILEITFSEAMDTTNILNPDTYKCSASIVDSVVTMAHNYSKLHIYLNANLQPAVTNILQINQLQDLCGNMLTDTTLLFYYNNVDENDIVISELMVDPSPPNGLPEAEYVELFNRSNKDLNLENWTITINATRKILPDFELNAGAYVVLCHENYLTDFASFGATIGIPGFPTMSNQSGVVVLSDSTQQTVNDVVYFDTWYQDDEKQNGGWSLEIIDPDNTCSKSGNWIATKADVGGTPCTVNSTDANNLDIASPYVQFMLPVTQNTLIIDFTEAVNIDANLLDSFGINGDNFITGINTDSVLINRLWITFTDTFLTNSPNVLNIKNISDFCGNVINDTSLTFTYIKPGLYDVVINEVMMNPTPSAGLPEFEYIEIKNNTKNTIYIYNWTLSVNSSERTIDYALILPNDYLLVGDAEAENAFRNFGNYKAIASLPALPQEAQLQLFDENKNLICQTNYTSAWIGDDLKADGGYSLERIDPENSDETIANWSVSSQENGGTPGVVNSVYQVNPDVVAPDLLRAHLLTDTLLMLTFSEIMDFSKIQTSDFSLSTGNLLVVQTKVNQQDLTKLLLQFNRAPDANVIYEISINSLISDVSGNPLNNTMAKFSVTQKASEKDIIINELLFNPYDRGSDFVELYNNSDRAVNLNQFFIATRNADYELSSIKTLTTAGVNILPGAYMVITEDWPFILENYQVNDPFAYYQVADMPAFSDNAGTVVLLDTTGLIIDEFSYTDDFHFALLQSLEGVSLERINPDYLTQDKKNWHSASELAGWATPGYKNSVYQQTVPVNDNIAVSPEVFSPDNDGYNDFVTFTYQFNEPGNVAKVVVFDKKGRQIRKIANNELLGTEGYWIWDGLTDDKQKAPAGIYAVYFEIFNLDGSTTRYKKVCTINTQF